MAKKIYVQEPVLSAPVGTDQVVCCYGVLLWEEGQLAVENLPCSNDGTRVDVVWGDTIAVLKAKVLANIETFFGVGSNDIIFLGGWA